MTKQRSSTPSPIQQSVPKENVVEGVLQNYLDQLLVTATQQPQRIEKVITIDEEPELDVAAELEQSHDIVIEAVVEPEIIRHEPIAVETITAPEVESKVASKVESKVPSEATTEVEQRNDIVIELVTATDSETAAPGVKLLTDKESWSSQGVECLVFSVSGLKLAVPLLYLGGVHEVAADEVKPLMGQPSWYLGMVNTEQQNLQVIDTANFIMPEREQHLSKQGFKYLIQLEKTPWAIACQSIDDTVRLEATEIKWRGERGKRTWLAGTVIEKMCALVDVAGLLQTVELNCKPI